MLIEKPSARIIAKRLYEDALRNKSGCKHLMVRTLLAYFGYNRRSEEGAAQITQLLVNNNLEISPSINKIGGEWPLSLDDKVRLEVISSEKRAKLGNKDIHPSPAANDKIKALCLKTLRTEREVESKFVVPLLNLLGFEEDDRLDGGLVQALNGAKNTTLTVDFALYANEEFGKQVVLTAEAKYEKRLATEIEIESAYKQAKSYALWTDCYHCLVTDGIKVRVCELARGPIEDDKVLFSCNRDELAYKFGELYSLISKESLIEYHREKYLRDENDIELVPELLKKLKAKGFRD